MADETKHANLFVKLLLGAIALLFAILYYNSCTNQREQRSQYEQMLKDSKDSTKYYINKAGQQVATRTVVEGSRDNLGLIYSRDSLQRIADRFKTTISKLESYVKLSSRTESSVPLEHQEVVLQTPATDYTGSCPPQVKYMTGTFRSQYVRSEVRLGDSAYNKVSYTDSLEIVTKDTTKGNIFNRRTYKVINITSQNPDAHYRIDQTFAVEQTKKTKWAIVGYGGIGYDPLNFNGWYRPVATVGIGIGRVLVRIR